MPYESYYDLSIPRAPQPPPTLLLKTVENQLPALPGTPLAVPRVSLPTEPTFAPCAWRRSGVTGYHPDSANPCSGGIASSPVLQTYTAATNVAAEFAASSADNATLTTLDCSREHQPLLQLEAALAQEPEPGSKTNALQYCLIGILFAGLVIAAVSATTNAPGGPLAPHDLLPEEERRPAHHQPRPSYHVSENVQTVLVVPSIARPTSPVVARPTADESRNRLRNSAAAKSVDQTNTAQHLGQLESAGAEKYVGEECRRYYYTYCAHPMPLFHYDPEQRVCVSTSDDGGQLCNHGSNRFSSWETCRASCLQADRVSESCSENTLFLPCTRQDVVATFWYFDGRACTTWDYPRGNCPQSRRGVYETFRECSRQCEGKKGDVQADSERCGVPEAGACSLKHLKYPFFADMQAEGSARCVNVSRASLLRCLVGSNQFHSLEACQRTCLH
ncbi:uncharacterized protein [Dermacentor albipictus]|uniref:uncharacterized protein n=1 Tax=Dermacentor albipictus TaxID=60249 RepID=UPI0038FCA97A